MIIHLLASILSRSTLATIVTLLLGKPAIQ